MNVLTIYILIVIITISHSLQEYYLPISLQKIKWEVAGRTNLTNTTHIALRASLTLVNSTTVYFPENSTFVCPKYSKINRYSDPEVVDILFSINDPIIFLDLPKFHKRNDCECDLALKSLPTNPDFLNVYDRLNFTNAFVFSDEMNKVFQMCYTQPVPFNDSLEANINFCYHYTKDIGILQKYVLKAKSLNTTEDEICVAILSLKYFLDCTQFAPETYLMRYNYYKHDISAEEQIRKIKSLDVEYLRDLGHCPNQITRTHDGKELHWLRTRVERLAGSQPPCLNQCGETIRIKCLMDPYRGAYWSEAPTTCYNNITSSNNNRTNTDFEQYIFEVAITNERVAFRLDITCYENSFFRCELKEETYCGDTYSITSIVADKYMRTLTEIETIILTDLQTQGGKNFKLIRLSQVYECQKPLTCGPNCRGDQVSKGYWTAPRGECTEPALLGPHQINDEEVYCSSVIFYWNRSTNTQLHWNDALSGTATTYEHYLPVLQEIKWEILPAPDRTNLTNTTHFALATSLTLEKSTNAQLSENTTYICAYFSKINRRSSSEIVDILFSTRSSIIYLDLPKLHWKNNSGCDLARKFLATNPHLLNVYNEFSIKPRFVFSDGMKKVFKMCYTQPVSVLRDLIVGNDALEANIHVCYNNPYVQAQGLVENYVLKAKILNTTDGEVCTEILRFESFLNCTQFRSEIYLLRYQYSECSYSADVLIRHITSLDVEYLRDLNHCPNQITRTHDGKELHWLRTRVGRVAASQPPCLTRYEEAIQITCLMNPYTGAYWSEAPTTCYNNIIPPNGNNTNTSEYILKIRRNRERIIFRLDITCYENNFIDCGLIEWSHDYFIFTMKDEYFRTQFEIEKIIQEDIRRQAEEDLELIYFTEVYKCVTPPTCIVKCKGDSVLYGYWTEPPDTCSSSTIENPYRIKKEEMYCPEDKTYSSGSNNIELHWNTTFGGTTTYPVELCLDDIGRQITRTCILDSSLTKPRWSKPSGNCSLSAGNFIKNDDLTMTENAKLYCSAEVTQFSDSDLLLHWNDTLPDTTAIPRELCLDEQGRQVTRTCILNVSSTNPYWSEPPEACSLTEKAKLYCSAEVTHLSNSDLLLHWSDTLPDVIGTPRELCVDGTGRQVTRTCKLDPFSTNPYWSESPRTCSAEANVSRTTRRLHQLLLADSSEILADVSRETEDTSKLKAEDINLVSQCLKRSARMDDDNSTSKFFTIIDNVIKVPNHILRESQVHFNSTDRILDSIEIFTREMSHSIHAISYVRKANILIQITYPFNSNVAGLALYGSCLGDLNGYEIVGMKLGDSFEALSLIDLDLATYVPAELITSLTNGLTEEEKKKFKIINTVFFHDVLFKEVGRSSFSSGTKIIDVDIPEYPKRFETPIPLLFRPVGNFKHPHCVFWDYGERKSGTWSNVGGRFLGVYEETALLRCSYTHLTHFALLVPTDVLNLVPHDLPLTIITCVGAVLSTLGIIAILATAICFKHWCRKRYNSLHLCVLVLLEIIVLFVADFDFLGRGYACAMVGAALHYILLAKFVWMFLIARVQYFKFVKVLGNHREEDYVWEHVLIGWFLPALPVIASLSIFPQNYDAGVLKFCYPKADALLLFLIAPAIIIVLANVAIFTVIVISLSRVNMLSSNKVNTNKYKVRLAIMLFFMLGLTWCLGLTAIFLPGCWTKLRLICVYSFCILVSMQGLVMFVFNVLLNEQTVAFWRSKFKFISVRDQSRRNISKYDQPLISISSTDQKQE